MQQLHRRRIGGRGQVTETAGLIPVEAARLLPVEAVGPVPD